jgi:hypothetical protein
MENPATSDPEPDDVISAGRCLRLDPETVAWRMLEDVVIVYCDLSGATHQFSEFDGWVVRQIAERPTTLGTLVAQAGEVVDLPPGPQLAQRLEAIVQTLDAFALLARPA